MNKPTCRWDGEHWLDPDDTTCNRDHCGMRGRCAGHVDHKAQTITCPSCIGRTRRDLAAIELLATLMHYDAEVDGIDSEAMNLLGPAAAPEQYAARRQRLEALYQRRGYCDWPRLEAYQPDDPHHPATVLTAWDGRLRDQGWLGQTDLFPTVSSAVDALTTALKGPFPHGDLFEDFARDIATCRRHLEAVDHDDHIPEQGRPCPTCAAESEVGKGPRLRKRFAEHPGYAPGQRCNKPPRSKENPNGCEICPGLADAWHCPNNPAHAWTDDEYRHRLDADYLKHAEALTADQLGQLLSVKPGTVRVWANRGRIKKRGKDHLGRQLYDAKQAEQMGALA